MRQIDQVLESFIRNEIQATEARLHSISELIEAFEREIERYQSVVLPNARPKVQKDMIIKLFNEMIEMYSAEKQALVKKRLRMVDQLSNVQFILHNFNSTYLEIPPDSPVN